ncbi:hypothetical protein ACFE04_013940 [Oxalis oulophora]
MAITTTKSLLSISNPPLLSPPPLPQQQHTTLSSSSLTPKTLSFLLKPLNTTTQTLSSSTIKTHLNFSLQHPPQPSDDKIKQAQVAVSGFLQSLGVSVEEADYIAMNSSKYVEMLVGSVDDLDEWNSWKGGGEDELGFGDKVVYMAKEKGDYGKVAFLESVVGLSLASAMGVARYLAKETLPELIHKVKYMKEIFFSGSDDIDKGLIGKNAHRMMMHLSIPIDEDVQQTLSFFSKIEARRGGLQMLGSTENSFRYLIESFPRLLLSPVESNLVHMVNFFESIGVPKHRIRNILLLYPPVMFCTVKDIETKQLAFTKVGLADKDFGKMLVKYPWILSTSIQENYKEIASFFEYDKVPRRKVDRAIKSWPHLLGCSTVKLRVMVDQLHELGVRNEQLGQVIAKSPQLLLRKPQEVLEVVSFLRDLGFEREQVGEIMGRCPEIFATSIDKTLNRKLESLSDFGVSKVDLPRIIKKYPEFLVSDVGSMFRRLEYLMEVGLSKRDISWMLRRFSPLLGYSIEKVLRPKTEFLVNTMEKRVRDVVEYPRYFSYSLEKKIKPRFYVLKARNMNCSLKDMLGKNDEDFATDFMGLAVGTMTTDTPSDK